MTSRRLTPDERHLAASMFGDAIDYDRVRMHHRRWWWFHPPTHTMSPDGDLWFHPRSGAYCANFCDQSLGLQAHFMHEMTHVWQAQKRGKWWLPLMRHPWCSYQYRLKAGQPFERYGIEQQAEIVRHAFLYRKGVTPAGAAPRDELEALLPFLPSTGIV